MTEPELYRLFRRLRAMFARSFGPRVAIATLAISDRQCTPAPKCSWRDVAYAEISQRPRVVVLRRVIALPRANVLALLAHELGHIADRDSDRPGAEQRADDIAECVTGRKIRYDALNLQTFGRGRYPRPLELHQ